MTGEYETVYVCDDDLVRSVMFFFFQAEDGIRDLVRSRGLGDVYKRQMLTGVASSSIHLPEQWWCAPCRPNYAMLINILRPCLLYTSDAADERSSVDLGGRRIIKKKTSALL